MYSQESIDTLVNRIGWSELSSGLPFGLSIENKTAESGNTFDWYHPLVLVDNIYAGVPEVNMSEEDFNEYLFSLKKKAVNSILKTILDKHVDYDPLQDYSSILINRSSLFDDAIGYSVAINMLQLFISTSRSNFQERSSKMSYQTLKFELEGAKNDNGHFIAKGIIYALHQSIKVAQDIIFPFKIVVRNGNVQ